MVIEGVVEDIIYKNAENGYCVLRLQCEDGELTNVVGMIPMPVVGERLLITPETAVERPALKAFWTFEQLCELYAQ